MTIKQYWIIQVLKGSSTIQYIYKYKWHLSFNTLPASKVHTMEQNVEQKTKQIKKEINNISEKLEAAQKRWWKRSTWITHAARYD